jgi:hypothetical protein
MEESVYRGSLSFEVGFCLYGVNLFIGEILSFHGGFPVLIGMTLSLGRTPSLWEFVKPFRENSAFVVVVCLLEVLPL